MRCDPIQTNRITRLVEPSTMSTHSHTYAHPNPNRTDDEWTVSPMIFVPNQLVGAPSGTDVTIDCNTEAHPKYIKNPFYIIYFFLFLQHFVFYLYEKCDCECECEWMSVHEFCMCFSSFHFHRFICYVPFYLVHSSCNSIFFWVFPICCSNKENEQTTVQRSINILI